MPGQRWQKETCPHLEPGHGFALLTLFSLPCLLQTLRFASNVPSAPKKPVPSVCGWEAGRPPMIGVLSRNHPKRAAQLRPGKQLSAPLPQSSVVCLGFGHVYIHRENVSNCSRASVSQPQIAGFLSVSLLASPKEALHWKVLMKEPGFGFPLDHKSPVYSFRWKPTQPETSKETKSALGIGDIRRDNEKPSPATPPSKSAGGAHKLRPGAQLPELRLRKMRVAGPWESTPLGLQELYTP